MENQSLVMDTESIISLQVLLFGESLEPMDNTLSINLFTRYMNKTLKLNDREPKSFLAISWLQFILRILKLVMESIIQSF